MPVAIKDNMCTEGLLTTCSSKILYNFIPTYTAEAVKRLEDAGCVIVGKPTWMSLPWEAQQRHLHLEQPKPMEYRARTGRFIRRKLCSSCSRGGTICTRFRYRRIDQTAKLLLRSDRNQANLRHSFTIWTHCHGSSLDQIGPIAKDVTDCATILEAIASYDKKDSTSVNRDDLKFTEALVDDVKGMKIGIPKDYLGDGLDPEVKSAILCSGR